MGLRNGVALLVLIVSTVLAADAPAIGRSGGRTGGGGDRGGAALAGAAAARSNVTLPSVSQPAGARGRAGTGLQGDVSRTPASRANTSIPSLAGGLQNRPNLDLSSSCNRLSNANRSSWPNLPSVDRPSRESSSIGSRGTARPDLGGTLSGGRDSGSGRPDLGNIVGGRLSGGGTQPDRGLLPRPGTGADAPFEQPGLADRTRPELGGGRDSRPAADRLNDFLGIERPGTTDRPGLDNRPGIVDRPSLGDRSGNWDRPSLGDQPAGINRPNWKDRPDGPIIIGVDRNTNIHQRLPWVNIDNDRLVQVRNRWNEAILSHPGDLHNWQQRRPDRVARWRSWGNTVRFRWGLAGSGIFGPRWWNQYHPVFCGWHHWRHWNRHTWIHWWATPVFVDLTRWFTWNAPVVVWTEPIFYDYGPEGNIVFEDNRVFILGEDVGTVEEFVQSAAVLATVPPPEDEADAEAAEWMPLGTFAVSTSELEGEPTRFIQLAVSREGIVTGTYFNLQTEVAQTVLGQVDKETQRVAMRLGKDEGLVAETGLYNLTLDEAPVLVHFTDAESEFFLLVRMDPPEEEEYD